MKHAILKSLAIGAVAGAIALGAGTTTVSAEDKKVRLNMGSAFPGKLVQLGSLGKSLSKKVQLISGGSVQLKFFEPKALVPPPSPLVASLSRPPSTVSTPWSATGVGCSAPVAS